MLQQSSPRVFNVPLIIKKTRKVVATWPLTFLLYRRKMKEYLLELSDLFIRLQCEQEIKITDRTRPFIIEKEIEEETCCITVQTCNEIPQIPMEHHQQGMTVYGAMDEVYQIFHLDEKNEKPFAVVQFYQTGMVVVEYLPEYSKYFATSSDILNRICIEKLFSYYERMILHSSCIDDEGHGILFLGPSGIGKSTQARLWKEVQGANIVNGDRAAVHKKNVWTAWGIPYAGTSRIYKNKKVPIDAIIILKQAKTNEIEKVTAAQAIVSIYPEVSLHHWERQFVEKQMKMLQELTRDVPIYRYQCLPDESAVHFLKAFLEKERER